MLPSKSRLSIIALTAYLSSAQAQVSFPQCIRDCIDASPSTTCSTADIACLCRSSRSTLLVDIVTCMHDNCITIDPSVLLGPLQFACQIAGATIPQSVIDQAESAARSLETAAPTATVTNDGETIVSSVQVTTTVEGEGRTQTLVYPVTIEKTRTVTGEPATITQSGGSQGSDSQQTVYVPIVLTTTNSAGSTITTTISQPGAISTVTTTDSRGSTVTQPTTLVSTTTVRDAASSNSASESGSAATDGTTTIVESTTVAGVPFTSSAGAGAEQTSTTQQNDRPPSETNSAPFMNTNTASEMKPKNVLGWAVLVFLSAATMAWL